MFKQKLVHRLCTFKQKFAHTLCAFRQKFVHTLYTFKSYHNFITHRWRNVSNEWGQINQIGWGHTYMG